MRVKKPKKPKPPPGPKHGDIVASIKHLLAVCGYVYYYNWGGPLSEKGIPDITALEPKTGRYIGIEAKAGKDQLREDQIKWKSRILAGGGIFIEARTLEDVVHGLGLEDRFLL
jgi:hypothetical protein